MKKLIIVALLLTAMFSAKAQNIQTHYDMGKDRGYLTTTIEMFKADKWGNTFFFVDYDYNRDKDHGPSFSYFEIARCFSIKNGFSAQIEYNGGMFIQDAWLAGVDYSMHNADYTQTLSLKVLYKHIEDNEYKNSFQLTAVWGMHFFDRKVSFTGFADFWREKRNWAGDKDSDFIFLTEPQIWYNVNKHFSVGSEIEISNNFIANEFKVNPTLALKWNF